VKAVAIKQNIQPFSYLRQSIEMVMVDDDAANQTLAAFLKGLAGLYGIAVRSRAKRFRQQRRVSYRLPCKVVSVGNIALGGTGKTPMSLYLARLIHGAGYRVAVVSRGYKGMAEKEGGVVSDGGALQMGPSTAGDEPYLMAKQLLSLGIPVIVGRDRLRSGWLAVQRYRTEVIILDDGFQHMRLERDLDLVLLDARQPFGNGYLLPRGTLREPLSSLLRADACLLTGCPREVIEGGLTGHSATYGDTVADRRQRPIFLASHAPVLGECFPAHPINPWTDKVRMGKWGGWPVYAFSGIARNDAFHRTLCEMGFDLRGSTGFADHHIYSRGDLSNIETQAGAKGAQLLVTTEKDRVKIPDAWIQKMPLLVVGVRMDLGRFAETFERFVCHKLHLQDGDIV
jgi:tetraacyldisaccharide 4'-kinase